MDEKVTIVELTKEPTKDEYEVILKSSNEAAKASDDPLWSMDELKKARKSKGSQYRHLCIFYLGDKPIGSVMYMDPEPDVRCFSIGDFGLHKEYQGKGLGTQCFRLIMMKLKNKDPRLPIYLGVAASNTRAIKLYERFGFKILETNTSRDGKKKFHQMCYGKPLEDVKMNHSSEGTEELHVQGHHLYTYLPKSVDVVKTGIKSIKTLNGDEWKKYCKRSGFDKKEDVMKWLEETMPGRCSSFCAFTSPIPDDAPKEILEFRNAKQLVILPSYEELKGYGLVTACYAENLKWEPDNDEPEWKKVEHPNYSEKLVWKPTNPKLLFAATEHYMVIMKDGTIPGKYCTVEEDLTEESMESFAIEDFVRDTIRPAIRDGVLYHGSSKKFDVIKPHQLKELESKGIKSISLTPYKRLACLFCTPFRSIRENSKGEVIYHHAGMKLVEWFEDMPEDDMYKMTQTLHVLHNIKDLNTIDKTYTGYLYSVDANEALSDASENPISGKGPYEVLSFVKELKPVKVEPFKIRMIAKYDSSFAKEIGHDAERCEPDSNCMEEFNLDVSNKLYNESMDFSMEEGIQLLTEFNAGIEEFRKWTQSITMDFVKRNTVDPQVRMVCESIGQESILTDTVKAIFQGIAKFIGWFLKKLKEIWNYFFGRIQRNTRAFKALRDKIKKHETSNGFFNDGAFKASHVPTGLIDAVEMDKLIEVAYVPDRFWNIFNDMLEGWEKEPEKLYTELHVNFPAGGMGHPWRPVVYVGYGSETDNMGDIMRSKFLCKGTMQEAHYDGSSVIMIVDMVADMMTSYEKISKLISTRGNINPESARRMLSYSERADVTEQEGVKMANEIQKTAAVLNRIFKCYEESVEFILGQGLLVANAYVKYMK